MSNCPNFNLDSYSNSDGTPNYQYFEIDPSTTPDPSQCINKEAYIITGQDLNQNVFICKPSNTNINPTGILNFIQEQNVPIMKNNNGVCVGSVSALNGKINIFALTNATQ